MAQTETIRADGAHLSHKPLGIAERSPYDVAPWLDLKQHAHAQPTLTPSKPGFHIILPSNMS